MSQKRRAKEKPGMARWIAEISDCYAFLLLAVFPIFYNNNFIDIVRSKLAFYKVITAIYAIIVVGLLIGLWFEKGKPKLRQLVPVSLKETIKTMPKDILFTIIFFIAIVMSTLLSDYKAEAFLGSEGRRLGAMIMLSYLFIYLIVGNFMNIKKWMFGAFLVSNTIVILLGILDFWGLDILHMYDNLAESQRSMFISTVGNVNVNAGYLCLILPIVMVVYCCSTKKNLKILYAIFLWLGFYEGFSTVSDSFFLGIGAAYLVFFWFCCTSNEWMQKFLELWFVFFASCLTMGITYEIGMLRGVDSAFFIFYQDCTLPQLLSSWYVLAPELILILLLLFVVRRTAAKEKELPYRQIRKVFFCILAVVLVLGILVLIVANCREEGTWTGTFSVLNRLQLTDAFGSNRGYIWKRSLIVYGDLPWYQKLFGYGLNCFGKAVSVDYGTEMLELYYAIFIDAHNEALQFLVTTGIVGVIGYFGIFISSMVYYGKRAEKSPILMMGVIALVGYLAQAMVNNPQTFITPSIFLFLGILKCIDRGAMSGNGD